ncbi:LLM class flavin-dependent oxidoreductase [Salipiger sp. P9]|uniref:LLM class flavin-dependent oxidoreductase n=1 Tax=Salipiger pentaromativorans TaxID=2943193 RepID=UPI002157A3A6|nr:LLM class flavin-dependent oxidoreductase [Salipiger pentaromativorans]MCR8549213.1 LLM class flavin-dependent oxidoreductase [Salipiger pentaromativorans]
MAPAKSATRQMKLALHIHATGHHVAAWHHPRSQIDAGSNPRHYIEMAQLAERGKFDLIFLADSLAIRLGDVKAKGRWPQYLAYFEPLTLLSTLAAATSRIGLVATASTSYTEPYNLARSFGSLDHLSAGRAGWNIVTTGNAASSRNFGRPEHFEHEDRYRRAQEFVEIVCGLWDSYDDDAFVMDRASGLYADLDKMHVLHHEGESFSVEGPLNMRRPPQGRPVLFQAGTSETGKETAARNADVVFMQQQSLERCRSLREDIRGRLPKHGRDPDEILVMPGMAVTVGRTEAEAREQHDFLQSKIHPDVGRAILSAELGYIDLPEMPLDEPFPLDLIPEIDGGVRSTAQALRRVVEAERPTVRELYQRYANGRGSHQIVGDAVQVADELEHWFRSGAGDGFIIQPAVLPGGLEDFVELVVPELQRRGLYREEYEGATLRDHLGLARPESRYARPALQDAN